jgi:hypothetical protein
MSAGSSNSNLGYGNINPFLSSGHVNAHNSHSSQFFNSKEISGGHGHGIFGAKSNIDAANSKVPGVCLMKGGGKRRKGDPKKTENDFSPSNFFLSSNVKTKNLNKNPPRSFFMRSSSCKSKRKPFRNSRGRRRRRGRTNTFRRNRRRSMKGGTYMQYGSNVPNTPSYEVGGVHLNAASLNQANPPPIIRTNHCKV